MYFESVSSCSAYLAEVQVVVVVVRVVVQEVKLLNQVRQSSWAVERG